MAFSSVSRADSSICSRNAYREARSEGTGGRHIGSPMAAGPRQRSEFDGDDWSSTTMDAYYDYSMARRAHHAEGRRLFAEPGFSAPLGHRSPGGAFTADAASNERAYDAPDAASFTSTAPSWSAPAERECVSAASSKAHTAGPTGRAPAHADAAQRPPGKRRKRHYNIATKVRTVQPVPRGSDGSYEMPVQVGVLMVLSLGRVIWDRSAFHNERYIWPVGYTVQREYHSMIDPNKDVMYTCWVGEGDDAPLFYIESEDTPNAPVIAPTATGAWTAVLRRVNQIRHREHSNSASGPDYFGFSHPTIAKMVQDLPGVGMCRSYIVQHFVEMKDRHVRGVLKKGRGGRPSVEMLSRGQRALMASTSSSTVALPKAESPGATQDQSVAAVAAEVVAVSAAENFGVAKRTSAVSLANSPQGDDRPPSM
ncbi:hypothetical protein LPJ61_003243 [Coemansia biformis]|uniref:FYR N-terminal domain-containing protein n=1 Tax=Coemansia biformis TaxID=1286918 RepID=A0A9W8CVQ7_9FUNG|nr:hypothetical protein LPJ61_003243 [Coemansia biformis]